MRKTGVRTLNGGLSEDMEGNQGEKNFCGKTPIDLQGQAENRAAAQVYQGAFAIAVSRNQ